MSPPAATGAAATRAAPAFAALKALVVARTGHHYYADKDDQLAERIARRADAAGLDADGYLALLRAASAGEAEWRALEGELTIKETFFFRFAEQFQALRTTILPALIAARAGVRRLRVWSVGCSTGAEPYSVAIVLRELLGEAIGDWHVAILGTDIDEGALAVAREGRYGAWALRTLGAPERAAWFAVEGERWRLRGAYRAMVRFERLNALDLLDGGPLQLGGQDLILCRNMLIYFHPDVAVRLVATLVDRLAADGRLLLGHAEAGLAMDAGVEGVEAGGVVAYRRAGLPASGVAGGPPAPPPTARPVARTARSRVAPAPPSAMPPPEAPADTDAARRLLDAGDTAAAHRAIAALRAAGDTAPLRYLAALAALADGEPGEARALLRGALYLDPGFAMAHYLLGQALAADGRGIAARRAFANAGAALDGLPDDADVPEGDGRDAGALRAAVAARLAERAA